MKKLLSLLFFGITNISIAGTYDFSRIGNMTVYEAFAENDFLELIVQEAEIQNGKINEKIRSEVIRRWRAPEFEKIKAACIGEKKEKCQSGIVKDVVELSKFKDAFLLLEQGAQNDGVRLYITQSKLSFDEYKNMTLAELNKLPRQQISDELEPFIAEEYGKTNSTAIAYYLLPQVGACNMNLLGPKQRKEAKCDMKLKDLLKQL